MEDKIKEFLNSGLLEQYVFGTLSAEDQQTVEQFIEESQAVKNNYIRLQEDLEKIAKKGSISPRPELKNEILNTFKPNSSVTQTSNRNLISNIGLGILLLSTLFFAAQWIKSNSQIEALKKSSEQALIDCTDEKESLKKDQQQFAFIQDSGTIPYVLGDQLKFLATAYVNKSNKTTKLRINNSIELPINQCLQLWGDKDGKMIPLKVIDNQNESFIDIAFDPEMVSLNVTIEEKTEDGEGQDHPDVSQLIASVAI